ncbi:DUF2937 family protein [Pelagovum pacificum]|uniref:DUF2937 family protein n=1 Tax=Pelagovum pacificum TaxID=2588711 RepID=A0A5C5GD25_9RHOB|nr:DUF2937 family protein [Pelagovum pacificum]QQA41305.1 DUF2937 family protein [Pelagovum pacificum]TNY31889.1 DUF2937 family protein [Pelagovum pacificum]
MIIVRMLAMAGGLAGAMALSQYPEFSQQYTQRLAGQIDALSLVVADFDATAERSGLTRDAALAQMTGTQFLDDRRADMTRTFARYDSLTQSHDALQQATALERMLLPHRMGDMETLQGTWNDFVPAMPLSLPGLLSTLAGYAAGWMVVGALFWVLLLPFRRRERDHDDYEDYAYERRGRYDRDRFDPDDYPREPPLRGEIGRREPPLTRQR